MSPPAVSQQIRALEGYLRRPLFQRGGRSVRLTQAGRDYLAAVSRGLHGVEVATSDLFGDVDRAPLTITCSHVLATGWLARRLPVFQAAHPRIRLNLATAIQDEDYRRLGADLAITFGLPPAAFEDSDPLFGEHLCPVAPPEIAEQLDSVQDLVRFPLVEIATHRANWQTILPAGVSPMILHTDNTVTAFSLAAAGAVALDRAPATEGLVEQFGLVRCLQGAALSGTQGYSLVYPARSALRAPARTFRDWILAEAAASR